jgi:hypothetical protein
MNIVVPSHPTARPLLQSSILRPPNNLPLHLSPVDILVNPLVHLAAEHHVIPADQIQPVLDLRAGLGIVRRADYALDRVQQDEVGQLVRGQEGPDECAPIDG